MSEEQLRDLLRRAVPEAPELDPTAIGALAERQRRTRRLAAGAAGAVLLVGGATLAAAGLDGDRREERGPSDVTTSYAPDDPDRTGAAPSPYDVAPCPARLPEPARANRAVADLDGVVAVRLCPDLNPRGEPAWAPTPEQRAQLEDADALVSGLADFTADLRRISPRLPEYCAEDEGPYVAQALAFYRADGTRVLMAAPGCELVTIEQRRADGGALRGLFLAALDRQRARLTYTRPFDDELSCHTEPRGGPILPGRERLVAAVACDLPEGAESIPLHLDPVPLDRTQLGALERAWERPGEPVVRGPSGRHACVDLDQPPSYILAATDHSDVVQLLDSPCGFLVWHGEEVHQGATLPTTLAELGLE